MKFENEEFPIWFVVEENLPEFLPNLTKAIEEAGKGGVDEKYTLASALFSLIVHPFITPSLKSLTKRITEETFQQALTLLNEGVAQDHAESIHFAAYCYALGSEKHAEAPDFAKADALYEKIKDNPAITAEERVELASFIEQRKREERRKPGRNPGTPAP